jgi:hypothetical protein
MHRPRPQPLTLYPNFFLSALALANTRKKRTKKKKITRLVELGFEPWTSNSSIRIDLNFADGKIWIDSDRCVFRIAADWFVAMHIDLAAIHNDVNSPVRIDLNQSFLSGIALAFFESIWHRCRSIPEMLDLHRFQIDLKSAVFELLQIDADR